MHESKEEKYKIIPKFNFVYEMGMPSGKKIRISFFILIVFLALTLLLAIKSNDISIINYKIADDTKIKKVLMLICIIADVIAAIRLIGTIILQKMQYNHVTYSFYEDMMTYEDDFLNQHKKTIKYKNIKEIEIRRTIWDRILNYGLIVIYTNADNSKNNGLVIYSIKDPKKHYEIIDELIHGKDYYIEDHEVSEPIQSKEDFNNDIKAKMNGKEEINAYKSVESVDKQEQDFKESLKNVKKY